MLSRKYSDSFFSKYFKEAAKEPRVALVSRSKQVTDISNGPKRFEKYNLIKIKRSLNGGVNSIAFSVLLEATFPVDSTTLSKLEDRY